MRIREMRAGEGGRLCQIFVRAVKRLGASAYEPHELEAWISGMTPEKLERRLLATRTFVAEHEGLAVGFASLEVEQCELDFLYVDPTYVRQGIGRALNTRVESAATAKGLGSLYLTASLNAEPIYEHMGYRRLHEFSKCIDGVTIRCVRMEKQLRTP